MITKLISILALTISVSYGFTCGKHSNLPLLSNKALITSDSVVCYPTIYKNFKYEPLSNYELNEVQFKNITGLYISN